MLSPESHVGQGQPKDTVPMRWDKTCLRDAVKCFMAGQFVMTVHVNFFDAREELPWKSFPLGYNRRDEFIAFSKSSYLSRGRQLRTFFF